jgi:hypothetical protein
MNRSAENATGIDPGGSTPRCIVTRRIYAEQAGSWAGQPSGSEKKQNGQLQFFEDDRVQVPVEPLGPTDILVMVDVH